MTTKTNQNKTHPALELYRTHARPIKRPFSLPLSSLLDQSTANGERAVDAGDDIGAFRHLKVRREIEDHIFGEGGEQ